MGGQRPAKVGRPDERGGAGGNREEGHGGGAGGDREEGHGGRAGGDGERAALVGPVETGRKKAVADGNGGGGSGDDETGAAARGRRPADDVADGV
jgi:hypothetical protein